MKLRISSVPAMLEYCAALDSEEKYTVSAEKLFCHEDYLYEMRRYGLLSPEPLVSYFSRLKHIRKDDIPDLCAERKNALRDKHELWLNCAADTQKYYKRYEKVRDLLNKETFRTLTHRLSAAFPEGITMNDADVVSTLSFGPSFGYVYENALHIDLFCVEDICTLEELPYIIQHELHHLQIQKLMGSYHSFTEKFNLLENYIFRFTGEGLAVKFCNNVEGILSRRVDKHLHANIGIPAFPLLNSHFEGHFNFFCDTVRKIQSGSISADEIDEQFRTYWWNPHLYENETAFLPQTAIYSFGNELFGWIFDSFGLEVMFSCFYNPVQTIEYFNKTNCGYTIPTVKY